MEAVQVSEKSAGFVVKSELNQNSKRNIGELAMGLKVNEEPKSPARKGVKIAHEAHLRQELEQWKQLVTENGIRQSIILRDANHLEQPENLSDILTNDQRHFIDSACDVQGMIDESREFRRKFEFVMCLNNELINLSSEIANETLDVGKEQAFRVHIEDMQHGIPRFYPKMDKQSMT